VQQRRILVIHYTQTGQLNRVVESVLAPLADAAAIQVERLELQPQRPFPFPWPFLTFFSIFPETVAMRPQPLQPLITADHDYDLIILAYQVWFLSPSLPISSFPQSAEAARLLAGKPVVTLIACRGMWLMAQEKVKGLLSRINAHLVDNAVLSDHCGSAMSFLATPLWMFTGNKQPWRWVPPAGVSDQAIADASRFGVAIRDRLLADGQPIAAPMLRGLNAVTINDKLIASEKVGQRSFALWGRLLSAIGPMDSRRRRAGLVVYVSFLLTLILTVVPVTALLKKLLAPLVRQRIAQQKRYFAEPSGE